VVKQDDRIKKENLKTMYHKIWSGFMKRNGKNMLGKETMKMEKRIFKTMYHKIWSGIYETKWQKTCLKTDCSGEFFDMF
jgi:hypothetical protein